MSSPARLAALLAALAAVGAGGGTAWWFLREPAPPPPAPTPVEERAAAWRAAGGLPAGSADDLVARGATLLAADLPERTAEARLAFRGALAADPGRADAVAGYATAFADAALEAEDPDGEGLKEAHALLAFALSRTPGRADLLAAQARLLLLAPSERNRAEALTAARQARGASPGDGSAVLALGLALLPADPLAAAAALEAPAAAGAEDRRLLSAAARAHWAAGDAVTALRLAETRLEQDPLHPAMLSLAAEIEAASARADWAEARLRTWRSLDPAAPQPLLLLARLAAQVDGDLGLARRLLAEALPLARGDWLPARILAHQAAVALALGDVPAAERAAAAAVAKVPAGAPGQYQAAVLAFRRGDRKALAEAAGVVGQRCGVAAARRLAAREAELGSATLGEAAVAWKAWPAAAPRDPSVALEAAGALARIGFTGDALALARRATSVDPVEGRLRRAVTDCWEGPAGLAEAARRLGEIADAEQAAAVAALEGAAAAELLLGHTVAAEKALHRVLAIDPGAWRARMLLAQVALDRGRPATAARHAAAALALPGGQPAAGVLARALAVEGRPEALALAGRALAEPGASAARLLHARLLAREGRGEEGAREARALLADDPSLGEARGLLLDLDGGPPRARP